MKKLLIANWKSNKSREDAIKWMDSFEQSIKMNVATKGLSYQVVICPPMSLLMYVSNKLLDRSHFPDVRLGVQDISPYSAGSYTGATSVQNLEGFNVQYAIVGHSERRRYFHETSQEVAMKVEQCLSKGITPIVCVDKAEIVEQANLIDDQQKAKIIVAYEPHEFIGTGKTQEVSEILREIAEVHQAFGNVQTIYGASVDTDTMKELISYEQIEGFLVGSASLDPSEFAQMSK